MRCPKCHLDNPDGAKQCARCGESLADPTWGETRVRPEPEADRSDRGLWGETAIGPDPSPASFEPGGLIAGRYEVIRELGRGGMGVVYLVRDRDLGGQERALKTIHPALVSHPEALQRLTEEVIISQELTHPNIVKVFHLEVRGDQPFFTMEYIPGRSLRQIIEDRKARGEKFSLAETATIIGQVLDALDHAHQKTIHRDIKPDNILLRGDWPDVQVKVMDFGIARTLSPSRLTSTARSMGTAYYMAPEQLKGARDITPRADLYSVGVVLYEMLTGDIPTASFDMPLPSQVAPDLPPRVDDIVRNALRGRAEDRFAAAAEFRTALDEAAAEAEKSRREAEERLRREEEARQQAEVEKKRQEEERRRAEEERKKQEKEEKRRVAEEQRRAEVERRRQEEVAKRRREEERRQQEKARQKRIAEAMARAETAFQKGRYKEAIQAFEQVLAEDENHAAARQGLEKARPLFEAEEKKRREEEEIRRAEEAERRRIEAAARRARRRKLTVITAVVLLVVGVSVAGLVWHQVRVAREKRIEGWLTSASQSLKANRFESAIRYYRLVLNEDAANQRARTGLKRVGAARIDTWLVAARKAVKASDFNKGIQLYRQILNQNRSNPEALAGIKGVKAALWQRAKATFGQKDYKQSRRYYELLERHFPGESGLAAALALVKAAQKRAAEEARQRQVKALLDQAHRAMWRKQYAQALKLYRKVLELSPNHQAALTGLRKVQVRAKTFTNSIGMKFVLIPAGSFMMGSPSNELARRSNEGPQHRVVVSRPFYMQTTEVTQAQYRAIMGKNPSQFKGCDRCPVERVSWNDAQEFIRKLNAREGTNKYRLPTEAEWEYACRAGTRTPFSFGRTISTNQANYNGNFVYGSGRKGVYRKMTTPVGSFPPNRWGLYDMHGNVWEWCGDRYGMNYYSHSPTRDPRGPSSGQYRVFRGGCWKLSPGRMRSAFRLRKVPWSYMLGIGFRVLRIF